MVKEKEKRDEPTDLKKNLTKNNYNRSYYIKNRESILKKNRERKKYCRTLVVTVGEVVVRFD